MSPSFLLSFLPSPPKEGSDSVCVHSCFFCSAKAVFSEINALEGAGEAKPKWYVFAAVSSGGSDCERGRWRGGEHGKNFNR